MKGKIKNLSIIIPAYNEEKRILNTIIGLKHHCNTHVTDWEIIIVNDGSTDLTPLTVLNYLPLFHVEKNKSIKLLNFNKNRGKGYAVKYGLLNAKYPLKMILDADLSVRPSEFDNNIQILIKGVKEPCAILGQRTQVESQPVHRLFLGWCFRILVRTITGVNFQDSQCPFKVLKNIPDEWIKNLKINGFAYDVEMIKKFQDEDIWLPYPSVNYHNKDDSKVTIRKTIKMFFDLLEIRKGSKK